MVFDTIEAIKKEGFTGFRTMSDLFSDSSALPGIQGVYLVLYKGKKKPEFLSVGTGGHFKGKNPNVSIPELKSKWVDGTMVVYIGKAGGEGSGATLQSRLRQYFRFGQGANVGHWGGRLIWQLKNSGDLIVCWKVMTDEDPRMVEANLIREFVDIYGKRPFANLKD